MPLPLCAMLRGVLVAWGPEYRWLAKNICLPSLGLDCITVFTDEPEEFPGYKTIRIRPPDDKIELVTDCYKHILSYGDKTVILCADMVFGEGAGKFLQDCVKDLVVVPAVRLNKDKFLHGLHLPISNRDLCKLALANIHPGSESLFWGAKPFSGTPYQIYWRNEDTLVARCIHMHPILMKGNIGKVKSIDGGGLLGYEPKDCYIVTDSDEFTCFELSEEDYVWYKKPMEDLSKDYLSRWMKRKANHMHQWFFTHDCYMHSGELNKGLFDTRIR